MTDNHEDQRGTAPTPSGEIRSGVTHLARDFVTLAELQANLLQVESRTWLKRSALPALIFGMLAAITVLASLPVMLLSFAYWLREAANLSLPLALLAAGGAGLLLAIIFALVAFSRIRRGRNAFTQFKLELSRNMSWLKQILSRPADVADPMISDRARIRPR